MQYRYTRTVTTTAAFTNVANWEKVVTFTDTYSTKESDVDYINNLTEKGVYRGRNGVLYVIKSSGIVYQILQGVGTNGYYLTFRKKENDTWSSNSIFDDRLHLPVIKANGSLTINKDNVVFKNCYIYFNYSRKEFAGTLNIEGDGVYCIIADHSTTTITLYLSLMDNKTFFDLARYTIVGIINVVNGVIDDVLINAIGNVVYNNKINVDNKIEVYDSVLLNTGYYIGANGILTPSVSWNTWIIKAKKGDVITATLGSNAFPEYMIAAYSSQKFSQSFIEGIENKFTTSSDTNTYYYLATEDSFILVSNRTTTLDSPIIHHYTNSVNQTDENPIIISTYPLYSGYLENKGTSWSTNPKKSKHIKIPVSFCERYSIKGVGDNINYAFLSDEEGATSIDEVRHTVADGVTDTVIVPFAASFLYVQLVTSAGVDLTENVEIVKLSDYILPTWQVAQHDLGIMDIEYSVLGGLPGNSMAHFERAVSDGFKYLKADMRITSDGYVVLCHDAGYTFDDGGRIISYDKSNSTPINTLTLAEVKALEFASQVSGEYVHPCSLEEFLVLCKKHGVTPYLTVRPEDYVLTIPESLRLLKKYSLDTVGIYNLYTTKDTLWSICRTFNEENSVLRCYTIHGENDVFDESQLAIAMEIGCAYIDIWKTQEPSLTDAMWEIVNKQKMRVLSIVTTESDFEESVGRGIVGFQNYSRNKFGS